MPTPAAPKEGHPMRDAGSRRISVQVGAQIHKSRAECLGGRRSGFDNDLHRAPGSDGVRRAYVRAYEWIAQRRKSYVGRVSLQCVVT